MRLEKPKEKREGETRNHGRLIKEVELEEHRVTETKRISRKEKMGTTTVIKEYET